MSPWGPAWCGPKRGHYCNKLSIAVLGLTSYWRALAHASIEMRALPRLRVAFGIAIAVSTLLILCLRLTPAGHFARLFFSDGKNSDIGTPIAAAKFRNVLSLGSSILFKSCQTDFRAV